MERIMSVEDKIKRAEEIYARRHELDSPNTGTVNIHEKEKKDMKLFKKMSLQIIACLLVYSVFFTIKNNNYIFSEDFVNKSREILSYDINFEEIYNSISKFVFNSIKEDETINPDNNQENVENKDEEVKTEGINDNAEENIGGSNEAVTRRKSRNSSDFRGAKTRNDIYKTS